LIPAVRSSSLVSLHMTGCLMITAQPFGTASYRPASAHSQPLLISTAEPEIIAYGLLLC
jgi:hypothetical protein